MKFCMNCGTKLEDDAMFCFNCGTKADPAPAPVSRPAAVEPPAPPAFTPAEPPAFTPAEQTAFAPAEPPVPPAFTPAEPPAPPAFAPAEPPAFIPAEPPAFAPAEQPVPPAFTPAEPPAFTPAEPPAPVPAPAAKAPSSTDHTAEFDAEDVHENKLFAALCYLFSFVGIAIALLGPKDSPYVKFHVRQALKLTISGFLLCLASLALDALCAIPIVRWVFVLPAFVITCAAIFLVVLEFIGFFQCLGNKAKEPILISKLKFLK